MDEVSPAQEFLARLKPLLEAGALRFEPRNRKTWEFLLREGRDAEDAFDIIAQLGSEHYQWGPRKDDNGTAGDVMLFYFPYAELFEPFERIQLYIKLKIWTDADGDVGSVMSFHEEGII